MNIFGFNTENNWDYENGFYLTSHIKRLGKIIAHFELYKMIQDLNGEIVECGIFKGSSLIQFATFRELLESPFSRKIIGFDAFGYFPSQNINEDEEFAKNHDKNAGKGLSLDEFKKALDFKHLQNIELVKGDINSTIPKYIDLHKSLKISLLHIDVDVYEPTITILESLFDRVVRNGIIVLDDYSHINGETRAIDEFFADRSVIINKLSVSHIPSYIVKQ